MHRYANPLDKLRYYSVIQKSRIFTLSTCVLCMKYHYALASDLTLIILNRTLLLLIYKKSSLNNAYASHLSRTPICISVITSDFVKILNMCFDDFS
jgi:hypothetical protein